jgi:hypothetical protein
MFDPLAQLAEHLTFNQGVRGSNPRWVTTHAGVAELADALDLGSSAPVAYEFKSLRPHHFGFYAGRLLCGNSSIG